LSSTWKERLGFGKEKEVIILSPIEGETHSITEVNDPTFSEKILGDGIAIMPTKGEVIAPVDGTIAILFGTNHAISIVSEQGTEILIHIGLDTINLKGEYFRPFVKANDKVKTGDLLLTFDIEKIKAAGYDLITPIVICNTAKYSKLRTNPGKVVNKLDQLIVLKN
jgi:glucose-specific phosphotransferase system IIA component